VQGVRIHSSLLVAKRDIRRVRRLHRGDFMVVLFKSRIRFVAAGGSFRPLVAGCIRDATMLEAMQIEAILLGNHASFDGSPHKILERVIESRLRQWRSGLRDKQVAILRPDRDRSRAIGLAPQY